MSPHHQNISPIEGVSLLIGVIDLLLTDGGVHLHAVPATNWSYTCQNVSTPMGAAVLAAPLLLSTRLLRSQLKRVAIQDSVSLSQGAHMSSASFGLQPHSIPAPHSQELSQQ